jgi:hypothetical protein
VSIPYSPANTKKLNGRWPQKSRCGRTGLRRSDLRSHWFGGPPCRPGNRHVGRDESKAVGFLTWAGGFAVWTSTFPCWPSLLAASLPIRIPLRSSLITWTMYLQISGQAGATSSLPISKRVEFHATKAGLTAKSRHTPNATTPQVAGLPAPVEAKLRPGFSLSNSSCVLVGPARIRARPHSGAERALCR